MAVLFNHLGRDGVGGFEVGVGRVGGPARECRDEFPPPSEPRTKSRLLSGSRWRESAARFRTPQDRDQAWRIHP